MDQYKPKEEYEDDKDSIYSGTKQKLFTQQHKNVQIVEVVTSKIEEALHLKKTPTPTKLIVNATMLAIVVANLFVEQDEPTSKGPKPLNDATKQTIEQPRFYVFTIVL